MLALAQSKTTDYEVKSSMLLNFALFVEWSPAVSSQPKLRFCYAGAEAFEHELQRLRGKTVRTQIITTQRITLHSEIKQCDLLFITEPVTSNVSSWLDAAAQHETLTVLDSAQADNGQSAVITLDPDGKRLSFTVDVNAAKGAKLSVSSHLLKLARKVKGMPK